MLPAPAVMKTVIWRRQRLRLCFQENLKVTKSQMSATEIVVHSVKGLVSPMVMMRVIRPSRIFGKAPPPPQSQVSWNWSGTQANTPEDWQAECSWRWSRQPPGGWGGRLQNGVHWLHPWPWTTCWRCWSRARAGMRTVRELKTLGVILDHLAVNQFAKAADVVSQRIKALERATHEKHWGAAQFLELLPPEGTMLLDRDEEMYLAREYLLDQRLKNCDQHKKWNPERPGKEEEKKKVRRETKEGRTPKAEERRTSGARKERGKARRRDPPNASTRTRRTSGRSRRWIWQLAPSDSWVHDGWAETTGGTCFCGWDVREIQVPFHKLHGQDGCHGAWGDYREHS